MHAPGNGADDVKLVDLDGLGEPEVIVVAVKGCGPTAGIYSYNAGAGSYDQLRVPRPTGFKLDDLDHDGRPEIVTTAGLVRFGRRGSLRSAAGADLHAPGRRPALATDDDVPRV